MPTIDLEPFLIAENASEEAIARKINVAFDTIADLLNGNLDNANVKSASLQLDRVDGAAVPVSDTSAAGAANKLIKANATGDITLINNAKIFFQFKNP